MNQFKPGDKVRRIKADFWQTTVGSVYTVKEQYSHGFGPQALELEEVAGHYAAEYFELVEPPESLDIQIEEAEKALAELKKKKEELEKPRTYRVGQKFSTHSEVYRLCYIGNRKVILINSEDGNYWSDAVCVNNPERITQSEFDEITAGHSDKFTLIN